MGRVPFNSAAASQLDSFEEFPQKFPVGILQPEELSSCRVKLDYPIVGMPKDGCLSAYPNSLAFFERRLERKTENYFSGNIYIADKTETVDAYLGNFQAVSPLARELSVGHKPCGRIVSTKPASFIRFHHNLRHPLRRAARPSAVGIRSSYNSDKKQELFQCMHKPRQDRKGLLTQAFVSTVRA